MRRIRGDDEPPEPEFPLLIIRTKADPQTINEANVLSAPGFEAIHSMVNRRTGEGMVAVVLADQASVKELEARADRHRAQAAGRGVELGQPSGPERIFAAACPCAPAAG